MCLAVPAKIKSIDGNMAYADMFGIEKIVDIELIENPHRDDYILVHAGFAIEKINMEYYDYLQQIFEQETYEEADTDEK